MRNKGHIFIERSIVGALSFLKDSVFADEYASRKGFLQARDPRFKTLMILLLLLSVLFAKSIPFIGSMYLLCLLLAYISSIDILFFLKRTWLFIPVFSLCIALPALFNIFSPGEPLLTFKMSSLTLVITKQGMASAVIFFMRVLTSVSLCVLLTLTTKHYVLLKTLHIFKVPQIFVMTLGMCYRYIYLFIEIIQNTYSAIKSRVEYVPSVKKGQGIVAWNIANLWQRSYALSNQVYNAMLSRGYSGEVLVIDEFHATYKDWVWLGVAILLLGVTLWRNYYSS